MKIGIKWKDSLCLVTKVLTNSCGPNTGLTILLPWLNQKSKCLVLRREEKRRTQRKPIETPETTTETSLLEYITSSRIETTGLELRDCVLAVITNRVPLSDANTSVRKVNKKETPSKNIYYRLLMFWTLVLRLCEKVTSWKVVSWKPSSVLSYERHLQSKLSYTTTSGNR